MTMPTNRRKVMNVPLVMLAVFAAGGRLADVSALPNLLEQARPAGVLATVTRRRIRSVAGASERALIAPRSIHVTATIWAIAAGVGRHSAGDGVFTCWRLLDPTEVRKQFAPIYRLLWNKWYFDELYHAAVRPPGAVCLRRVADFDSTVIDGFDRLAARGGAQRVVARRFDRPLVRRWAGESHGRAGFTASAVSTARLANGPAAAIRDVDRRRHGRLVRVDQFFWNLAWGS